MTPGITVAIPTVPYRSGMLARALASVATQTLPAEAVSIAVDLRGEGAPATRQRALDAVQTEWVGFLDDDDEFMPFHLAALMACARDTNADYVYSYYMVRRGGEERPDLDPLETFGHDFDPVRPSTTTSTTLVRTELAKKVGFRGGDGSSGISGEDDNFAADCVKQGAKIVHHPQRTWWWNWHGTHTSGLAAKWKMPKREQP